MGSWSAFEEDQEFIRGKLEEGFIDHLEVVSRVAETKFFQTLIGSGDMERLAATYPSPRKKNDVPLWVYLSSQLTLRLHGAPGFSSLPYILHCGGLRDALESDQVERKADPATGEGSLHFKGYNEKNTYDRSTPCDQDYVRKLARDTDPQGLEAWFSRDVARYLYSTGAYDPDGVFMIDGSYLFVPDNPRYELSRVGRFDEHNHIISREDEEKLGPAQRRRCRFRRYYRVASLAHTNRKEDYLLYAGARLLGEGKQEVQALVPLVDDFVGSVGRGILKILLVDRGFIDGKSFGHIKKEHGIDIVVPLKAKMSITEDAWRLAEVDGKPWVIWTPPPKPPIVHPPERPEHLRRAEEKRQRTISEKKRLREEVEGRPRELLTVELKVIPRMTLWDECPVPLDVVLMREHFSDGEVARWGLMTTLEVEDPFEIRELYHLRSAVEEGWRQTKCFWDLTGFRSCSYSLVTSQIIFVLLAYTLLEVFLLKSDRGELAKQTRQRLLSELIPDGDKVAVYFRNRVGYFGVKEYTHIILNLTEGARRRLQGTIRRLSKAEATPPTLPRRPRSS